MALSLSMKDNIRIKYFVLISSKVLSVTSLLNFQNSINLKMSELSPHQMMYIDTKLMIVSFIYIMLETQIF